MSEDTTPDDLDAIWVSGHQIPDPSSEMDSVQREFNFHGAAGSGQAAVVDALLRLDPSLLASRRGWAASHAVWHGHTNVFKVLLDHGLDPNAKLGRSGASFVDVARATGHWDMWALLESRGGKPSEDPEAREFLKIESQDGTTEGAAFLQAAMRGDTAEVGEALTRNPSLLAQVTKGPQQTALHLAASYGHRELAKLLLDRGAEVNAETALDESPLTLAWCSGHRELWEVLHQAGGIYLP